MRRRPLRRALLAAAALLAALASGFLFVRDASVFRVQEVTVRGASGPDAPKVEEALRRRAREMTTLNVDADALRKAVAAYPTVKDIEVDRDLFRAVTLTVLEKRPVAVVEQGGRRVPLSADGRLLAGATPPDDLPSLDVGEVAGARLSGARGRSLVALVAAAPAPLRRRARRATVGSRGLTLVMQRGPELWFGSDDDLAAKWKAVARVLADPAAEGASYIDVRVPERTAAGGLFEPLEAGSATEGAEALQTTPQPPVPSTSSGA